MSFVRFIPKQFLFLMLLYVFKFLISSCLLLQHRNTVGFCITILDPATIPNSHISSSSFFGRCHRVFYIDDVIC